MITVSVHFQRVPVNDTSHYYLLLLLCPPDIVSGLKGQSRSGVYYIVAVPITPVYAYIIIILHTGRINIVFNLYTTGGWTSYFFFRFN